MRISPLAFGLIAGLALAITGALVLGMHTRLPRDDLVFMRLERTACLGRCPGYALTISANGDVEYVGRYFVRLRGRQVDRVSQQDVSEVLGAFERSNFLARRKSCAARLTDMPSFILTLELRDRTKRIVTDRSCENVRDLSEIARTMDSVTDVTRWTEPNPGRP